jgi:hypothetical protein
MTWGDKLSGLNEVPIERIVVTIAILLLSCDCTLLAQEPRPPGIAVTEFH